MLALGAKRHAASWIEWQPYNNQRRCWCAGSIGGVAEACCLQPMDVIKTRLQLDKAKQYTGERRLQQRCSCMPRTCMLLLALGTSPLCDEPLMPMSA